MNEHNSQIKPSLIDFPCHFPIKVMGAKHEHFTSEILKAIQKYAPQTQLENITVRPSSNGNYIGATVTVYVENQSQLDNIYQVLTSHTMVKVVF